MQEKNCSVFFLLLKVISVISEHYEKPICLMGSDRNNLFLFSFKSLDESVVRIMEVLLIEAKAGYLGRGRILHRQLKSNQAQFSPFLPDAFTAFPRGY